MSNFTGTGSTFEQLSDILSSLDLEVEFGDQTLDPAGTTDFNVAAAINIAAMENKAAAWLDDGARLAVNDDLLITSHATERPKASAVAATSGSALGIAGAANFNRIANQATSYIGYDAVVDVFDDINVNALSEIVSPVPTFDPSVSLSDTDSASGIARVAEEFADANALGGLLGGAIAPLGAHLAPHLANPATVGTAYVHAGSAASGATISGGVTFVDVYGMAAAGVAHGAQVNQHPFTPPSATQDITITALSDIDAVALAGLDSALSLPGSGGTPETSVGGYFDGLFVDNYARAQIDDRADVRAERDITLDADDRHPPPRGRRGGRGGRRRRRGRSVRRDPARSRDTRRDRGPRPRAGGAPPRARRDERQHRRHGRGFPRAGRRCGGRLRRCRQPAAAPTGSHRPGRALRRR